MTDVPASIREAIAAVEPPDPRWAALAADRQARLTMPPGSLGRLLEIGRQLAAIQRTDRPEGHPALLAVFAADHGVAAEGVSAYPAEVTGQMVANYLRGGAAVNVLARRAGATVLVADLGVAHPPGGLVESGLFASRPIRRGTSSVLEGPAMSRAEAFRAVGVGLELAGLWIVETSARVVGLGEMGIGNSTTAAILAAALIGKSAKEVVGRGTGVDGPTLARKREVVAAALDRHTLGVADDWDWASRVGGFEILGLAGFALGAAARRVAVVLDGFISGVAGLLAARLCPAIRGSLIASHVGTEPGHRVVLDALGLAPILELGLRLGEGTGAALALPIIASAADLLRDMATFEGAGVSGPSAVGGEGEGRV